MENKYNIDNIQALTACEHVRLRPNLFFEKCFNEQNLDSLPLETACHAIDEVFDKNCNSIEFSLFDDYFSLMYNAGMSLEKSGKRYNAELIMTSVYACRNEKKHLSVGEEFCELGIATINFASEYCELTTVSNKKKGIFHFKKGEMTDCNVQATEEQVNYTEIILKPDERIFKDLKLTFEGLKMKTDALRKRLKGVNIILKNNRSPNN